jgi:hypothetical protein
MNLIKTRMVAGTWDGLITGTETEPVLSVTHRGAAVPGVAVSALPDNTGWYVRIPIPAEAVSDGVQTILISDNVSGARLGDITLIAGDPLDGDIRAELTLLRAELDLLKRAFRRHCVDTGAV